MAVLNVIEVLADSSKSWKNAAPSKTLIGITFMQVKDRKIEEYCPILKITFRLNR